MSEEHSKLSPSASDRWLQCSVAPSREALHEDVTNEAAEWGTAAHKLAEHCLLNGIKLAKEAPTNPLWDSWDDLELRPCVQEYLDLVNSKLTDTSSLYVEQKLTMYAKFGVYGTADAVIIDDHVLKVIDLKGGKGVFVETEDNPQLMLYAWGAYDTLSWAASTEITHVEVTICQPRKNNTVSVTFTVDYLTQWIEEQRPKVEKAFRGVGVGNPGEHCRWCRAKGVCKERAEANLKVVSFDFNEPIAPDEDDCHELDEDQLVNIFIHIPQIRQYLTDIETEVTKRAHDHHIDGLKFVAGRSVRKIVDEALAAKALTAAGVEPYKEPSLLGITEIEKRLKTLGLTVESIIGDVIEKVKGAPILVPESDKRKEITAGDDFT